MKAIEYDEVPCPNPKLEGPCHVFRGYKAGGYGKVHWKGGSTLLHRRVWEQAHGPIPSGLQIDHQCRNRACCNVKHLRLVTPKINSTENVVGIGWQVEAAKTQCKNGHPFNEANTRWSTLADGSRRRTCRICARTKARYYRKKKEVAK